jgi:hypothetical protein
MPGVAAVAVVAQAAEVMVVMAQRAAQLRPHLLRRIPSFRTFPPIPMRRLLLLQRAVEEVAVVEVVEAAEEVAVVAIQLL